MTRVVPEQCKTGGSHHACKDLSQEVLQDDIYILIFIISWLGFLAKTGFPNPTKLFYTTLDFIVNKERTACIFLKETKP
jgi:hypothetical protein